MFIRRRLDPLRNNGLPTEEGLIALTGFALSSRAANLYINAANDGDY
jgi:hypothetical protein